MFDLHHIPRPVEKGMLQTQTCADPGIFVRGGGGGGVQVSLTKKAVMFFYVFFVLSLFYRSQIVNFKEIFHFSRFQRGVHHFAGGSNFFKERSNCFFPIETHITCDFPGGGSGPPVPPPLDPHLPKTLTILTLGGTFQSKKYAYHVTENLGRDCKNTCLEGVYACLELGRYF